MRASLSVRDETGFTLAELLVVLLIVAVLASMIALKLSGTAQVAARTVCRANINTLQIAAELYHLENGSYPPAGTIDRSHPLARYTAGGVPACQAGGVYVAREEDGAILVECSVHGGLGGIRSVRR